VTLLEMLGSTMGDGLAGFWEALAGVVIDGAARDDQFIPGRRQAREAGLSPLRGIVGKGDGLVAKLGTLDALRSVAVEAFGMSRSARVLAVRYDPEKGLWCVLVCPAPGWEDASLLKELERGIAVWDQFGQRP
jgi:hypothetical protein